MVLCLPCWFCNINKSHSLSTQKWQPTLHWSSGETNLTHYWIYRHSSLTWFSQHHGIESSRISSATSIMSSNSGRSRPKWGSGRQAKAKEIKQLITSLLIITLQSLRVQLVTQPSHSDQRIGNSFSPRGACCDCNDPSENVSSPESRPWQEWVAWDSNSGPIG